MNGVKTRPMLCCVTVKLFKQNEPEDHFDPCSYNNRKIVNFSSCMLSEKEISLINKGLSFVPTLDIDKTTITNGEVNLGRKLLIIRFCRNNYIKRVRRLCRNPTGSQLIK